MSEGGPQLLGYTLISEGESGQVREPFHWTHARYAYTQSMLLCVIHVNLEEYKLQYPGETVLELDKLYIKSISGMTLECLQTGCILLIYLGCTETFYTW